MEWVETTGRTVAEAKDAALDQLGVDDADAEFVVVNEPRAGLFGRMRGEARVRARVQPTSPRPKRTRSRRPAQEQRRDGGNRGGSRSGSRATTVADSPSPAVDESLVGSTPTKNGTSGQGTAHRSRRRGSRGGAGRSTGGGERAVQGSTPAANTGSDRQRSRNGDRSGRSDSSKEANVGEVLTLQEQGESAREFIEGLIEELGLDATVSLREVDPETIEVVVEGQELGILVGRGGATLGAIQELARTVVQSRTAGPTERILVDVAGYRAKRAEALQRFTRQVAEEVMASGSEQALEPMLAPDRKVVHDTVSDIDGVATRSEGEEPRRYVVLSPLAATGSSSDDD
ncbi:MAG TPA: RNA-binding cell elongation regulator Jag/EloR [Acidimicrobiales bacterium]